MAMGSRRTTPTWPVAAAVVSEAAEAPTKTPWLQSLDWYTSGAREARRPPKRMAEMGTPPGSSIISDQEGSWRAVTVKRELGCAAGPLPGDQGFPCQSVSPCGGVLVSPSHQGCPSGVMATLVKMVLCWMVAAALGLVSWPVPGATPNSPASGLMAQSRPSSPTCIQAMSSPTVQIL